MAGFPKGHPKYGGRSKGTPNKRAASMRKMLVDAVRESVEALDQGQQQAPLEFLVAVMNNRDLDLPLRLDAAKAAVPYLHPRLAVVDARVQQVPTIEAEISIEEHRRRAVEEIRRAFPEREVYGAGGVRHPPLIEHQPVRDQTLLSDEPASPPAEEISEGRPREFSAPGPLAADPSVERLPPRPRPPRPVGSGWSS